MADRVKYFLLGLLFLVVAGVIAYDKWNTVSEPLGDEARAGAAVLSTRTPPVEPPIADPTPEPPAVVPAPAPVEPPAPTPPPPPVKPPVVVPPPTPPPPAPRPVERLHVVQSGESLEGIALRYYSTRSGVDWIAEKNGLRDPNRIRVGQRLVIPARAESASADVARPPKATKTTIPSVYEVKDGDGDLYAICRRIYGSAGEGARVARIMDMNGLWSAQVVPGTKLNLPPK